MEPEEPRLSDTSRVGLNHRKCQANCVSEARLAENTGRKGPRQLGVGLNRKISFDWFRFKCPNFSTMPHIPCRDQALFTPSQRAIEWSSLIVGPGSIHPMIFVSILTVSWQRPATAILFQAIACSKSSLLLRKACQRVLVFLLHPRQTSMGRRGWQAIEVPQGWFNVTVVLAHRQLAEHPTARWGPSISGKSIGQTLEDDGARNVQR